VPLIMSAEKQKNDLILNNTLYNNRNLNQL